MRNSNQSGERKSELEAAAQRSVRVFVWGALQPFSDTTITASGPVDLKTPCSDGHATKEHSRVRLRLGYLEAEIAKIALSTCREGDGVYGAASDMNWCWNARHERPLIDRPPSLGWT